MPWRYHVHYVKKGYRNNIESDLTPRSNPKSMEIKRSNFVFYISSSIQSLLVGLNQFNKFHPNKPNSTCRFFVEQLEYSKSIWQRLNKPHLWNPLTYHSSLLNPKHDQYTRNDLEITPHLFEGKGGREGYSSLHPTMSPPRTSPAAPSDSAALLWPAGAAATEQFVLQQNGCKHQVNRTTQCCHSLLHPQISENLEHTRPSNSSLVSINSRLGGWLYRLLHCLESWEYCIS